MHCLEQHFVLSLPYLGVKAQQYFVSLSCVFLDKKTLIKILLDPGLNLTIFQGTRCRSIIFLRILQITRKRFHWRILSQSPDALNRKTKKSFIELKQKQRRLS